jgi:hypothetical protein
METSGFRENLAEACRTVVAGHTGGSSLCSETRFIIDAVINSVNNNEISFLQLRGHALTVAVLLVRD